MRGHVDRAMKHYVIAAGTGFTSSLEHIKLLFMKRYATKDDYAKALRVYQENLVEIKSLNGMKLLHLMKTLNIIDDK